MVERSDSAIQQSRSRGRFLIMGAGAVGSVIGGLLTEAGHDVWFCGRKPHIEAIRKQGLRISGIWGNHCVKPSPARLLTDLDRFREPIEFDYILLTVKSYDTAEATRLIAPLIEDHTQIVSLQNGLGNVEQIAGIVGPERTIGGRVIFGSQVNAPGEVEVTVYAEEVRLGSPFDDTQANARAAWLAAAFSEAGVPTKPTGEIVKHLWSKLLYNACLNPTCTLLQCHYGFLLEQDSTRQLMREIIKEIYHVAGAMGIGLFHQSAEEYERVLFDRLIPSTSNHFPSMWQDIRRGRRTEIDAMNGQIVKYGREYGVPTPVNATLTQMVKALERRGFPAAP